MDHVCHGAGGNNFGINGIVMDEFGFVIRDHDRQPVAGTLFRSKLERRVCAGFSTRGQHEKREIMNL
jgi:hypothetical protein